MTTTTAGLTVPYIVRVERGTINRGIYDIAVLFDPSKPWAALSPQAQWNGKVVYTFGASTGQPRLQFRSAQNWADNAALSRGFMVVDNSLTDSFSNSNRVLNAETLMMMKEHIADTYGEITYTLGNGCSGGSIQQNTAASIYPGLLDGIQPSCDYPDSITTGLEVGDCVLLVNFYAGPEWAALMSRPHAGADQCQEDRDQRPARPSRLPVVEQRVRPQQQAGQLRAGAGRQPDDRRGGAGRRAAQQLPAARRAGLRPGDQSERHALRRRRPRHLRLGHDDRHRPGSLRALQTGDNVGIQYGLNALLAGAITPEEFVTLNEKIGGFDADSNRTAARTTADSAALSIAYRAGIVASGANLGKLPIIDSRGYDEQGIHYIWRSFAERARIDAANGGNHGNQVMWRYGTALLPSTAAQVAAVTLNSLLVMDTWLSNLTVSAPKETINSARTQAAVIQAKPATAFDLCYLTGDTTFTTPVTDMAACDADPQARATRIASPSRRWGARGEHPEVPAEAAQPGGVRAGRLYRRRSWRGCKPRSRMACATGACPALASRRRSRRSPSSTGRAARRCHRHRFRRRSRSIERRQTTAPKSVTSSTSRSSRRRARACPRVMYPSRTRGLLASVRWRGG